MGNEQRAVGLPAAPAAKPRRSKLRMERLAVQTVDRTRSPGAKENQRVDDFRNDEAFTKLGQNQIGEATGMAFVAAHERPSAVLRPCNPAVGPEIAEAGTLSSRGRQSRFRKDLINLNKAVAKWLQQEDSGEISRDTLLDCIAKSPAVQHLRNRQSHNFDEHKFVFDLLSRAGKAKTGASA